MGLQRQHPMKTTLCNSLLRREHCSVPKPSPGALLRMPKLCVFVQWPRALSCMVALAPHSQSCGVVVRRLGRTRLMSLSIGVLHICLSRHVAHYSQLFSSRFASATELGTFLCDLIKGNPRNVELLFNNRAVFESDVRCRVPPFSSICSCRLALRCSCHACADVACPSAPPLEVHDEACLPPIPWPNQRPPWQACPCGACRR